MWIFIIFIVVTLSELYVIIAVGQAIGAFNTIMLVVLTAFIGSFLLKKQGFQTLKKVQQTALSGNIPTIEILEGVVLLVSGAMLLTPGFITDIIGLLGLLPWTRKIFVFYILAKYSHKVFNKTKQYTSHTDNNPDIIDAEFWEDSKKNIK